MLNVAHSRILALAVLTDRVAGYGLVNTHSLSTVLHQGSGAWLRCRVSFLDTVGYHNGIRLYVVDLLVSLS